MPTLTRSWDPALNDPLSAALIRSHLETWGHFWADGKDASNVVASDLDALASSRDDQWLPHFI